MPRIPRHKHTNLDHEITGEYYDAEPRWRKTIQIVIAVITIIALFDLFIGIDTEWLAGLVS